MPQTVRQTRRFSLSRFRIYKNPLSDTWRVDLSIPVNDPGFPSGHAYVGTLTRSVTEDGTVKYSGPIRALDSSVLQRDENLASSHPRPPAPAFLELSELPQTGPRQRIKRLSAVLLLASGQFKVEARYSESDAHITGKITLDQSQADPAPDGAGARRRIIRSPRAKVRSPNNNG